MRKTLPALQLQMPPMLCVFGGEDVAPGVDLAAFSFDLARDRWTALPPMPTPEGVTPLPARAALPLRAFVDLASFEALLA